MLTFYTALGTPLDDFGHVAEASLERHAADQISHGAGGLLVMGSMGAQPALRDSEFVQTARTVERAAQGRCPVYVGVMDNSIARVQARIDSLRGLRIDGVVATTPYYYAASQQDALVFFRALADGSPVPLYLYDLPGVTQCKLQPATVLELLRHPNIRGIKTGDLTLARAIHRAVPELPQPVEIFYSHLDTFDVAYGFGLVRNLDGMFCVAPRTARVMYKALQSGDGERAADCLDAIIGLRNVFAEVGIFAAFSHAMNLLGYEGRFRPDYMPALAPEQAERVAAFMGSRGFL